VVSVQLLGLGYVAIGAALATVVALVRGVGPLDGALLIALWPMYGPFLLLGGGAAGDDPAAARVAALVTTLTRAAASPLAPALPRPEAARRLADQLGVAARRLDELDALLARADLAPEVVEARARALATRGAPAAATAAHQAAATLRQLRARRDRHRVALDEVAELVAQLATQVELVRLRPEFAPGAIALVHDLVDGLDGLDALGEDDEILSPPTTLEA
jgi:hypothetical protein